MALFSKMLKFPKNMYFSNNKKLGVESKKILEYYCRKFEAFNGKLGNKMII
jgi:hypothetical protein